MIISSMNRQEFPGVAEFACSFDVPEDWAVVPVPADPVDFSKLDNFRATAVAMARYGAILMTVAVRPRWESGVVADWVVALAQMQGIGIEMPQADLVGEYPAVAAMALQTSADGQHMQMRIHLFEQGGFMFNVSVMAPPQLFEAMVPTFKRMLESFRLANPQASTVPLFEAVDAASVPESAPSTASELRLADDASSLDPEHKINRYFRDNGIGLVPRVVAVDQGQGLANLAAGAIMGTFNVPLGWHVIDDGRRTLIFDARSKVQINLNLVDAQAQSDDQILDAILADCARRCPEVAHIRLELASLPCLGLRGLVEEGQAIEQAYLVRRGGPGGLVLMTRVTSTPEEMTRAMNVVEVVLTSMVFPPEEGDGESQPAETEKMSSRERREKAMKAVDEGWWEKALEFEGQDRLEEAEAVVTHAVESLGGPPAAQISALYEYRMMRLMKAGELDKARQARDQAIEWMRTYASHATSGGEGAARSAEADQVEQRLKGVLGAKRKL